MWRVVLLGMQVAGTADDWSLPPPPRDDIHAVRPCPATDTGDVVACGTRDPNRYRLKPLPPGYDKPGGVPLAQTRVGGGTLGVTTQQANVGNAPSNRVMVTLKLPF